MQSSKVKVSVVKQEDGDILLNLLQAKAAHGEAFTKADRIALTMSSLLQYSRTLDEALPDVARTARMIPEEQRGSVVGAMVGLAYHYVDVRVIVSIMEEAGLPNLLRQRAEQRLAQSVAEGREQGKRKAMRTVLRSRFGSLPRAIERRIDGANADGLDALIARVGAIKDIEEL